MKLIRNKYLAFWMLLLIVVLTKHILEVISVRGFDEMFTQGTEQSNKTHFYIVNKRSVPSTSKQRSSINIFKLFGNDFRFGDVTTTWADLSILSPHNEDSLRPSSLLYRINIREVNKVAVNGRVMDYIKNLRNPCWVEKLKTSNPYKTNPLPAIQHIEFQNMLYKFQLQGQRHPTSINRTRCLPYFYVIGVSKSGTTDFFENLAMHPGIAAPGAKEATWWNARLGGSANVRFRDYVDLFDSAADDIWTSWQSDYTQTLTGEATPSYCYDNDGWPLIPGNRGLTEPRYAVPHAIRYITPDTKIILLLRNPTERIYSHFRNVRPHDTPEVFHQHVTRAIHILKTCFMEHSVRSCFYNPKLNNKILPLHFRASLYPVILHDWLTVFPRDQLMVIKAENYFRDRMAVLKPVFTFLGLGSLPSYIVSQVNSSHVVNDKRNRGSSAERMLPQTKTVLDDFLKPFNERLALILGENVWWHK